jgi:hypothetical protein
MLAVPGLRERRSNKMSAIQTARSSVFKKNERDNAIVTNHGRFVMKNLSQSNEALHHAAMPPA